MDTAVQSKKILFFCFSMRDNDAGGRRAWSEEGHIDGMDCSKESLVGRTARHGARAWDVSMASSAARRPLTLIVLRG